MTMIIRTENVTSDEIELAKARAQLLEVGTMMLKEAGFGGPYLIITDQDVDIITDQDINTTTNTAGK